MLHEIWDFLREGFQSVNAYQGLLIAIIAAILVPAWKRVWAVALGATIVHLIADVLIPVLADKAPFRLPPDLLEVDYWRHAFVLFIGYLIVIAVLFFIKRLFLKEGGGH